MIVDHERRRQIRYPGEVIFLVIDERSLPLIDLSPQSITFEGEDFRVGDVLRLRLVSALDDSDGILADVRVIRVEGFRVAAIFNRPTNQLEHYIGDYIALHFPVGRA